MLIRGKRTGVVHGTLVAFAMALILWSAKVQIVERRKWAGRANAQQIATAHLPGPRGRILDASGTTLADSRELVKLAVAPGDVRDPRRLVRVLRKAGVPAAWLQRVSDQRRKWVELPVTFVPSDIAEALGMRGVHVTDVGERVYVSSPGIRRIVGRASAVRGADTEALDGIESTLDSLLRGDDGRRQRVRDARGRRFASPDADVEEPRAGHTVTLTINYALQEIADRALDDAVDRLGADGGDIVVLDPHTGEIRALASRRKDPRSTAATAFLEPYEPGSTLKPFIAATLLGLGRAREDEVIATFNGTYTTNGRTIHDIHLAPQLSLADVIRFSSNVGIVRFAERLSAREEYEALRDLGFGTPTGVAYPIESPGTLREPERWSKQSAASLAIGYEIAVTPIQLALAYASIANGGELLAPVLISEIRDPDGTVVYAQRRRVVRRVFSTDVAARVRRMLKDVVTSGTATEADLATFEVAGKSGTARRTSGKRYGSGSYTASFVGLFPADNPRYVILVKLDNPTGGYYGGKTAAPVSKVVLEAAIAARDAALDRSALASRKVEPLFEDTTRVVARTDAGAPTVAADSARAITITTSAGSAETDAGEDADSLGGSVPFVVTLGEAAASPVAAPRVRPVPDVHGLSLRAQVKVLHDAGFRVQLVAGGWGAGGDTQPASGAPARTGSVVRLATGQAP